MNILLAMIPAFFWGTTYAVTQLTLPDWPLPLLGALRALPAGLILLLFKPSLPKKSQWVSLFSLGLVNISLFFSLIFIMALTLPSAIAAVGMVSLPVFALLYDWIINKRRPQKMQAIFAFILVLLAWLLFDPSSIELNYLGLIAIFLAILVIICGSTLTKSLATQMHWWTVLTWQLIIGGAILSIAAAIHASLSPQQYLQAVDSFQLTNALGLIWIIVLNTALSYGLYVWLLQNMSVVDFTFSGVANPAAGVLTGFLLLNESFTATQYLLMAGMILASLMPRIIESRELIFASKKQLITS